MKNKYVAGVDIGGTTVKLGIFNLDGKLLNQWNIVTDKDYTAEKLLLSIEDSIKLFMQDRSMNINDLQAVGMGVPGSVDETGIVTYAPNIRWRMFDAAGFLSEKLNIPVAVQNDANVAAFAELKCGSGIGKSSICLLTLGTGVGGGIVLNNKIITGFSGCGGEIGHITVNPHEKTACGCGRYGCLEQYASATGIARLASDFMSESDGQSALFSYENVTAKEVFDCVKSGDKLAVDIAEKFGDILGRALSNIACLFNPQIFVIGGGVSKAGDIVIHYIQKYFNKYAYSDCVNTEFSIASLGNDAGIYGGAYLALSQLSV